jgi:hypothetical protein
MGSKKTICGTTKCLRTIGQQCENGHDLKYTGGECGENLNCGCNKKCNGCMIVNGIRKCHFSGKCMPLGKRAEMEIFEKPESLDYIALPDDNGMAILSQQQY